MLEQQLQPVLTSLLAEEGREAENYKIVRLWFDEHTENLADGVTDLVYLCKLPDEQRYLVTHPVIGNWVLEHVNTAKPNTEHQKAVYPLLQHMILETRFNNHHTEHFYENPEEYNRKLDELNSVLFSNPEESMPIDKLLRDLEKTACVEIEKLRHKPEYTTDLGHGLISPIRHFSFITWYFSSAVEDNKHKPLGLSIMVVDDNNPEQWYKRLVSVGFKEPQNQQGAFHDCESALVALETGHYDVILTDLELGKGKMGGIEFAKKAYEVQKSNGIKPRISVFSYNDKKLQEAENELRRYGGEDIVFCQVNRNNKARFTAINFRTEVGYTL